MARPGVTIPGPVPCPSWWVLAKEQERGLRRAPAQKRTGCRQLARRFSPREIHEAGNCGDGYRDRGEACDDGTQDNTDRCLNTCVEGVCGDGIVNEIDEA